MRTYFVDANVFLRLILQDNEKLTAASRQYFSDAQEGRINLVLLPEILLEIEYTLRKVYKTRREIIISILEEIVTSGFIIMRNRLILAKAVEIYAFISVDLVDVILFLEATEEGAEVLSFDKDFKSIVKAASSWN